MKHQKDIFDLFRNSQHKLQERPSPEAWRRLERRLDQRRSRHRPAISRSLAIAAAILVLIALISVLSIIVDKRASNYMALNGIGEMPMENLVFTDVDREALKVVEFTHEYQAQVAYPVREGTFGKKLIPTDEKVPEVNISKGDLKAHLGWITGNWQEGNGAKRSIEQWTLDGNTLQGKGLLLQHDEVLFEEKMEIRFADGGLILSTYAANPNTPTIYKLERLGHQWVLFENKTVAFPQQIIIQYDGKQTLSTLYQNLEPLHLNKYQMEYMTQRNQLTHQRALRQLRKVIPEQEVLQ